MPTQNLITIAILWPLAQWGIDIVGLLPTTPTQKNLLLVQAVAFASIKDKDVVQYVWKNIVCRFRIPQSIVTEIGPQFDSRVVDPTRSTSLPDSLLNEKKKWVDFQVLENPSPRRNDFALESPLTFYFHFFLKKLGK